MLIANVPNAPPSTPQVVLVAQANSGQQAATEPHVLGVCEVINPSGPGQAELFPMAYANTYFKSSVEKINWGTATITILQQPKHGYLKPDSSGSWTGAKYLPNDDTYLGDDSFVMQVEGNGYTVKLHYFINITDDMSVKTNPNSVCKGGNIISGKSLKTPTVTPFSPPSITCLLPSPQVQVPLRPPPWPPS